jgi:enoyl-CoA hydratase
MSGLVTTTCADGVFAVTINRAEKRNALSRALIADLAAAFASVAGREDIVVATLTGAGDRAFAAGGDLDELNAVRTEAEATRFSEETRAALDAIRLFPAPVIAVLNGDALGGGAELAVACDIRIAHAHARIGFFQARLNIATAWGGGGDLFRLIGPSRALELICTAELVATPRALALGLVDAVAPVGEDAAAFVADYVGRFARQKPQVTRAAKSIAIMHRTGAPPAERIAAETAALVRTWVHPDHWAAVAAMGR